MPSNDLLKTFNENETVPNLCNEFSQKYHQLNHMQNSNKI